MYPKSPAQALEAQSKVNAVNVSVDGKSNVAGFPNQPTKRDEPNGDMIMAAMERDATIREEELEIREKELAINVRRDWRERVLLWIAGISCAVSLVSLWIAGLAIKVAALPR